MPHPVYNSAGEKIQLDHKPLGTPGAEGAVYAVTTANKKHLCAKIYRDSLRTASRERKVRFMVDHPPADLRQNSCLLCWPCEIIYEDKKCSKFIGFLMPKAWDNSILLYELCTQILPSKINFAWEQKFGRKTDKIGLINRLKLCVNIAGGINAVHQTQRYVLVDFKPTNVLVSIEGKVSIIDLDSMQIQAGSEVFRGRFATPEYVAAEGKYLNPAKDTIPETWDRFALGVVFYQLIFGLHPFAITARDPSVGTTISELISKSLFPFGRNAHEVQHLPPPHSLFSRLPKNFQILFLRCFDIGNHKPDLRPSASEWGKIMYAELQKPFARIDHHSNAPQQSSKPAASPPPKASPGPQSRPIPAPPAYPQPRRVQPARQKSWLEQLWDWIVSIFE